MGADFFLKMLNRGTEIDEQDLKTISRDIVDNVKRAANVIKHVRSFARQSEVIKTKVNINEPVKDVFKVLGHQIKNHQIDLKTDLAPDLPPIMADHNRLEQIFINLVSNAIDAMDEKASKPEHSDAEKKLTIRSFEDDEAVSVTVADTGCGMTKEVKDKLFEPFFTTKKTGKGTGLGISISYGIIRDYNGTIDIQSEVDNGTVFKISFPKAP
jgi:C4-dicarboxylate-specific signal transduction histidine kinase